MGWTFFWAFIDKLFGLGFATAPGKAWIDGASPTTGFLKFAVKGPLKELFQGLAGNQVVDVLFMGGLLLIGLALISGIGVKIAAYAGSLLLLLMYLAVMLPANNPFLDEHIIYIFLLLGLAQVDAGEWLGFGKWWGNVGMVKKFSILK